MKKILVVDDEASIRTLLTYNLEKEGLLVETAEDGESAYDLALHNQYDFILLDLMLPGMDGIEITKKLRQEKVETPIIILTARDEQIDKIVGLEMGADDYLTKPFSPREVLARMKAINRRVKTSSGSAAPVAQMEKSLHIGEITVYPELYEAYLSEELLELTPKEFELLLYFMQRKNRVIDRDVLLNAVWNYDYTGQTRIVDVHISHLREKIEKDAKHPEYLITVRGFGYKLQEPKR